MPYLEVVHLTGDIDRYELSTRQPVSIGSHSSNDIVIDDESVEMMHCRISWNKTSFEVVAAAVDGVELNGTIVQRANLESGDIIRFGSIDVCFHDSGMEGQSDDMEPEAAQAGSAPTSGAKSPAARRDMSWDALEALAGDDSDAFEEESVTEDVEYVDEAASFEEGDEGKQKLSRQTEGDEQADEGESRPAVTSKLREALRKHQKRPGQEDTIRSPLVLGLGGGAAVLLLVGATFYFMINRQTTEEAFEAAKGAYTEGKYGQADQLFEEFLIQYPTHELANSARIYRGMAQVDRLVRTKKDYPAGLKQLREFISDFQDLEEFEDQRPFVAETARIISLDAAILAGRKKDPSLLETSKEARVIFGSYAAQDIHPQEMLSKIEQAARESQAAILKYRTTNTAVAKIEAALKNKDTATAIDSWRKLVGRYQDLRNDPKIKSLQVAVLQAERERTVLENIELKAESEERKSELPAPLSILFQARSRTDEVSGGRAAPVISDDCCYGIDTVTVMPVWRRVIGPNPPFFPVEDSSTASLVLYDSLADELLRIDRNSGQLHWRVALEHRPSAAPLISNGRVLLPTLGGFLYDIDLGNGSCFRRVQFAQPITTPVALPDGERLLVAGEGEFFYTLLQSSLECERVDYVGHPAESIATPAIAMTGTMLSMGPYVLVCQNNSTDETATLRVFDVTDMSQGMRQLATARVDGFVLDPPVIRGQDLFVPSTGERVSSFTVSDAPGQPILTPGPVFTGEGNYDGPIFLSTGPERQVWMASSSVRRLQVSGDELKPDQKTTAIGAASQPLQYVDRRLFSARRRLFTNAVTVTRIDRDAMQSDAQAVLGAKLIGWSIFAGESPSIVVGNEAGIAMRLVPENWHQGGLLTEGAERLPLHEDLAEPLFAAGMDKGQLAIAAGGPEPKMWVLNRVGKIDRFVPLLGGPVAEMSFMSGRVLIPMQGRVKLVSTASGQPTVEDFTLPTDQQQSAVWKSVLAINKTDAVGVTESGEVLLLRYQTSPRHYLGKVSSVQLPAEVYVQAAAHDGQVAIADGQSVLHLFNASNLEEVGQRKMPQAVSNRVWMSEDVIYVETARETLHCLNRDKTLSDRWSLPLSGASLAGAPVNYSGQVIVPLHDGRIVLVDPKTGKAARTIETYQGLASEAFLIGSDVLIATSDGSLLHLTPVLQSMGE